MAHDPLFEKRIALALKAQGVDAEPRKMFGGVAFMVKGHMSIGITNKGDLMVRFNAADHDRISEWPGARPMTFTHREMKGFLFVDVAAVENARALEKWVKLSLDYIGGLPAKTAKKPAAKKKAVARRK